MPDQEKQKQVADALAALAGGAIPSETDTPSSGIPSSDTTVFTPAPAQSELSAPSPSLTPSQPDFPASPRATIPPTAIPRKMSAAASARPAVPQRPSAQVEEEIIEESADSLLDFVVEDEETIAAAPDASAFAPRVIQKSAHSAIYEKLFFRRTIIPVLLTCGVMLPTIGVWSLIDPNAPLAAIGHATLILLIVVGVILFGLGVFNAFQINHILKTNTAPR